METLMMTYCYLTMDIFSNLEKLSKVFFKDESNKKSLVVSSELVFVISNAFYTLIFASKNKWMKICLI